MIMSLPHSLPVDIYIYICMYVCMYFFYPSSHSHSLSSGHDQNAEASRIPGLRGGEGGKDQKLFVVKMESLTLGHLL